MKKIYIILLTLLSSCASQSGWIPAIDTYNSQNNANLQKDLLECKELANRTTSGDQIARDTITGTLGGAALGALGGLAFSNPGAGAIVGSVGGTAVMGSKSLLNANDSYKQSYINCMRNRGHNVIN